MLDFECYLTFIFLHPKSHYILHVVRSIIAAFVHRHRLEMNIEKWKSLISVMQGMLDWLKVKEEELIRHFFQLAGDLQILQQQKSDQEVV